MMNNSTRQKGTIEILRFKGLTDQEIEDIINQRQAQQITSAYTAGFKQGVRSTLSNLIEAAKYANQTDQELAS